MTYLEDCNHFNWVWGQFGCSSQLLPPETPAPLLSRVDFVIPDNQGLSLQHHPWFLKLWTHKERHLTTKNDFKSYIGSCTKYVRAKATGSLGLFDTRVHYLLKLYDTEKLCKLSVLLFPFLQNNNSRCIKERAALKSPGEGHPHYIIWGSTMRTHKLLHSSAFLIF